MSPNSNIHQLRAELQHMIEPETKVQFDGGGGGGYDGGMETRVAKLEDFVVDARERLTRIEVRLDQTATKADIGEIRSDMHKMNAEIKTWTLATMITIIGTMLAAIFGISQIYKASMPTASTPAIQPQPIIIYAQPAPPVAPAAAHAPPAKAP